MRAVVSLVARYRSPTTFEYANESCSDVSVGGMFIKSAAPAPAGTLLKLECDTDSGNSEAKIRGVARVVWLRREANEHGPSGMGVKFVKLEAGSRELIEAIVERLAEAGVEARSVSAAPEHRLAAGGGAAAAFTEPAQTSSPVKLVPSTPPAAAEDGESPASVAPAAPEPHVAPAERAEKPAAASVVQQAPRAAAVATVVEPEESRPSVGATGSSRPPKPQPSRFGWKIWAAVIVAVLIAIAIADRRGLGPEKTDAEPETPAAEPAPKPAGPAAAPPKAEGAAVQPKPSEPAAEPAAQPKAAEPAAAVAAAPAAAEPAAAEPKPAAPSGAADAPDGDGPLFPSIEGRPDYVVDFVSQPNGSSVTIDDKVTIVTPATINLGGMPERIKVSARKPGYRTSSIWMKRDGFELKQGVLKRRAVITLKAEPGKAQ